MHDATIKLVVTCLPIVHSIHKPPLNNGYIYIYIYKVSVLCGMDQNAGWSSSIKIDNSSYERLEEFKRLGTNLLYKNYTQEEIKSRLKTGNVCYHSVQNLLSSRLLSKNVKIKIQRTIILLVVLYGCETWSLTLKEERRLRKSQNRVLRIFGPKRDEVIREWRKLYNEELHDLYCSPKIVRMIKCRIRWAGHVARMGYRRAV